MADREKVIKGLECCTRYEVGKQLNNCSGCPYVEQIGFNQFRCKSQEMKEDALALLKEQGTRTGHWIEDETETYTENHDTWECSECHEPFTLTEGTPEENKFYFCPRCGADMR